MSEPQPTPCEPTAAPPASATAGLTPWEDPTQPRLRGLITTLWALLRRPGDFFRRLPPEGWQPGLSFGVITGSFGLMGALYSMLLLSLFLANRMQGWPAFSHLLAQSGKSTLILISLTPFLVLASLLLGSLCLWAALNLMGVPAGLTPALKINGYAQGWLLVAAVPILGAMVAACWNIHLTYKGVREMFRLTWWQAWGAVGLALFLEFLGLGMAAAVLALPTLVR